MKNLHIFKNTNEKFSEPYIEFINNNFDKKKHFFYHIGEDRRTNKVSRENIEFITKLKYFTLIKDMYKANKIILHGLMSPLLVFIFFLQPWLLKKCYWVVWGGDLYYFKNRKRKLKTNFYEFLRRFVIKNIGGIITHIKGDYELAQKWYGAKGKYYYSFMYPSNLFKEYDLCKVKKDNDKMYIQIGNSADPSNNHLEVFKKLEKYKDKKIEIICPLSYGNPKYRELIIQEGIRLFGDKFNPIVEFMPFNKYLELLAKIDIAIFNHERQQAMGNITNLLGLGKKVYIKDDITTWDFCIDHGLKVFSSNGNFDDLFEEMDESVKKKNIDNVKAQFSDKKLKQDWIKIFESKASR
jgi:hypothetical protein